MLHFFPESYIPPAVFEHHHHVYGEIPSIMITLKKRSMSGWLNTWARDQLVR